ncbi:MAG TPA: hypothetical protein VHO24_01705 [Opitutaceae bacterium]|nr:hypothetical protein [Opitutaceae bacterium]
MSLINDALKKAQRQHSQAPFGSTPPIPNADGSSHSGGHVRKRETPMAAQTMVLIVAGSIVLVVLSVVATVFLINRPSAAPKPAASTIASTKTSSTPEPRIEPTPIKVEPVKVEAPVTPIVIAASIAPVPEKRSPEPIATPPSAMIAAAPVETKPAVAKSTPPASTPRPVASAPSQPEAKVAAAPAAATPVPAEEPKLANHAESIHAFLDAIRLKGVRATGADSRVLMNEHVYRLNDLVDRSLGLRLTKVEAGKLTFTDAHGATYEKTF